MKVPFIRKDERGVYLPLVAGAIFGFVAIFGLSMEVGYLYLQQTKLQRALDAAVTTATALNYKLRRNDVSSSYIKNSIRETVKASLRTNFDAMGVDYSEDDINAMEFTGNDCPSYDFSDVKFGYAYGNSIGTLGLVTTAPELQLKLVADCTGNVELLSQLKVHPLLYSIVPWLDESKVLTASSRAINQGVATVVALDRSGSMVIQPSSDNRAGCPVGVSFKDIDESYDEETRLHCGSRLQALKVSASRFINALMPGDELGIVRYNARASEPFGIGEEEKTPENTDDGKGGKGLPVDDGEDEPEGGGDALSNPEDNIPYVSLKTIVSESDISGIVLTGETGPEVDAYCSAIEFHDSSIWPRRCFQRAINIIPDLDTGATNIFDALRVSRSLLEKVTPDSYFEARNLAPLRKAIVLISDGAPMGHECGIITAGGCDWGWNHHRAYKNDGDNTQAIRIYRQFYLHNKWDRGLGGIVPDTGQTIPNNPGGSPGMGLEDDIKAMYHAAINMADRIRSEFPGTIIYTIGFGADIATKTGDAYQDITKTARLKPLLLHRIANHEPDKDIDGNYINYNEVDFPSVYTLQYNEIAYMSPGRYYDASDGATLSPVLSYVGKHIRTILRTKKTGSLN